MKSECNEGSDRDALDAEIFWFSDEVHQSSFGSVNWSLLIWTWLNFCHLLRHTISDRRSIKITFVPSPTLWHIEIFSSPKYFSRDVWCGVRRTGRVEQSGIKWQSSTSFKVSTSIHLKLDPLSCPNVSNLLWMSSPVTNIPHWKWLLLLPCFETSDKARDEYFPKESVRTP